MRLLLFLLGICVGIGNRAETESAIYGTGFEGTYCELVTFQQCLNTVSGIGGFANRTINISPAKAHPFT